MSLRTRLQRLEQAVFGGPAAEPLVTLFEVLGDDDRGGGWRDREPSDYGDLVTQRENGRTIIVRPVRVTPGDGA
jgi:hypothetical protein